MPIDPGRRFISSRQSLADLLMQQEQAAPPIQAHSQGLASLLRQGLAGYMQGRDARDRSQAYQTMMQGLQAKPWVNPDTGQVSNAPAGGVPGAIAAMQGMEGNEYAGRNLQALLMAKMGQDQESAALADKRKYDERLASQKMQDEQIRRENERAQALDDEARQRETGMIDYEKKKRFDQQYSKPTPATTLQRDYEAVVGQGFEGSLTDYQIMINMAKAGQIYSPPSRAASPSGVSSATFPVGTTQNIPGSPADIAAREMEIKEKKQEEADQKKLDKSKLRQKGIAQAGGTVIQDLGRALNLIETEWTASGVPAILGTMLPKSLAQAAEAKAFVESALSNIGLDRLQQMRESSPTGGALGQVPIQQQKRLEQVLGSLDVTQRPEVVSDNIKRAQNIYMDIVYGTTDEISALVDKGDISVKDAGPLLRRHRLSFDMFGRPTNGAGPEAMPAPLDVDELIRKYTGGGDGT